MIVTAYICWNLLCKNAMGLSPKIGTMACPRSVPLGKVLCVDGKRYTCQDRTATWVDGRYDLFMGYGQEAHDQAIKFGKRNLSITECNTKMYEPKMVTNRGRGTNGVCQRGMFGPGNFSSNQSLRGLYPKQKKAPWFGEGNYAA